jgi:hypothetical protein
MQMPVRLVSLASAAAFIVVGVSVSYPGMMNPDSASQLWQARNWDGLHDWHPPIVSAIWALMTPYLPSPSDMLLLQCALFALGIYNFIPALAAGAKLSAARIAALAAVAALFAPMTLLAAGFIAKDSLMSAFFFAAASLCCRAWAENSAHTRLAAVASLAMLILGALCRTNGFVPAAGLAALWIWTFAPQARRALDTRRLAGLLGGAAAAAGAGVLLLLASGPINNGLLGARHARALDSLLIFDLAGITYFTGENQFDRALSLVGELDGEEIAACYLPDFWDVYRECGPVYSIVQRHGAQGGADLRRAWIGALTGEPLAYLRHRAGFFFRSLQLDPKSGWEFGNHVIFITEHNVTNRPRGWEHVTPEMTQNVQVWRPHVLARALQGAGRKSVQWILQGPALWLVATLAMLFVSMRRILRGRALDFYPPLLALSASAAASSLALFFIGVHDASRYHMWTFFVMMLAALLLLARAPAPSAARAAKVEQAPAGRAS